jgi:hypothetical protein
MVFEFVQGDLIVFFLIFVIFIVIAYKLFKFIAKAAIIGLVAALFPVVGNYFLGLNIPITLGNIIWFAVTGIGLFVAYSIIRTGWRISKVITKPIKWIFKRKKKKRE